MKFNGNTPTVFASFKNADCGQGRSAKYSFTSAGWKRILNIIRTSNGTINMGLVQSLPYYMTQALAIDFSGVVKYLNDTSDAAKPVLFLRYNNIFGEDDALENPAKITQVRIGYPKQGTEFPETDGVTDYSINPINCYVEIFVDYDPNSGTSGKVVFNMNYSGFADSHNCTPITEELNADDVGIYGEELEYVTFDVESMPRYLTNDSIDRGYGLTISKDGAVSMKVASNTQIDNEQGTFFAITPVNVKYAVQKHTADLLATVNDLAKRVEALESNSEEPEEITFTVTENYTNRVLTCTAKQGMTWREWIESDYNPISTCSVCNESKKEFQVTQDGYIGVESEAICFDCGSGVLLKDADGTACIQADDVIISSYVYMAVYGD